MTKQAGMIRIPEDMAGYPLGQSRLDPRVVDYLAPGITTLGQFAGRTLESIIPAGHPSSAEWTQELCDLLDSIAPRRPTGSPPPPHGQQASWAGLRDALQAVAPRHDDTPLALIPHDGCIDRFLARHAIATVGDLRAFDFLTHNKGLGRRKLEALAALVQFIQDGGLDVRILNVYLAADTLIEETDRYIGQLTAPGRGDTSLNRNVLLRRLGSTGDPDSLEDIGADVGLTRERVRQIVDDQLNKLRTAGGLKLDQSITLMANYCARHTEPLWERLLRQWLRGPTPQYRLAFYLVVAALLAGDRDIPVWAKLPVIADGRADLMSRIADQLQRLLREHERPLPVAEAFSMVTKAMPEETLSLAVFFGALRAMDSIHTHFRVTPRPWTITLTRLPLKEAVTRVLEEADEPLNALEIEQRGQQLFGKAWPIRTTGTIVNLLSYRHGVFRLGPNMFGLEKHLDISHGNRKRIADAFHDYLKQVNVPAALSAFLKQDEKIASLCTLYTCAAVIQLDARFKQVGMKYLFALNTWRRQPGTIRDEIIRAMRRTERPLPRVIIKRRAEEGRVISPAAFASEFSALTATGVIREVSEDRFALTNPR